MIKLIINADDFGVSKSVNGGIVKAHREGILTSTTIMANMPYFMDAVSLARQHSELGIGIHLNVIRGAPLSDPMKIPTLIDDNRLFCNKISKFIFKFISGQINPDEIRTEYRKQIERAIDSGLKPTHLDSEKHHHLWPQIFPLAVEIAKYFNIQKVRYIDEYPFLSLSPASLFNLQYYKAGLLSFLSKRHQNFIKKRGIKTVDKFYGVSVAGKMTVDHIENFLKKIDDGIFELMCHPGLPEPHDNTSIEKGKYYITQSRPIELKILLDEKLKEIIHHRQIRLVHYGEL